MAKGAEAEGAIKTVAKQKTATSGSFIQCTAIFSNVVYHEC